MPPPQTRSAPHAPPDAAQLALLATQALAVSTDAVISIDERQRIVLFNCGAERIFGYAASEVLGEPLELLLPMRVREGHHAYVDAFVRSSVQARYMAERSGISGRRKSGAVFPAEASISQTEIDGRIFCTAVLRDVSDRWRRQERQRLLADAGSILAAPLDDGSSLANLAQLVATGMSAVCIIEVLEGAEAPRTVWASPAGMDTTAHRALVDAVRRRAPEEDTHPVGSVLRSGRSRLLPAISEARLREIAGDELTLAPLLAAGPSSMIAVPLEAHGARLGALVLVTTPASLDRLDDEDLELAEELARRVSVAVENRRLHRATAEAEAGYRLLFERNPHPMCVFDPATHAILAVNSAAVARYGYTHQEFLGLGILDLCAPDDRSAVGAFCGGLQADRAPVERRHRAKDGSVFDVEVVAHELTFGGHRARLVLATDITARKRAEQRLHALSITDELTGLYNRRGFFALAEQQHKVAQRRGATLALVYADLDDFKRINDTYGHKEGDLVLARAAAILRQTFRESDVVARLGGDEFVVLAMSQEEETSDALVARLRDRVATANAVGGRPYEFSMSVGVARLRPDEAWSLDALMTRADAALYEYKRQRRAALAAPAPR